MLPQLITAQNPVWIDPNENGAHFWAPVPVCGFV
jgi:hypothetical protein